MKFNLATLALAARLASAEFDNRCDAPYPNTYCNTTSILAFESSACTRYHIFLARGSDEPYPGRQGNVTREICSRLGNSTCSFENIEYPARSTAWGQEEWCKSAAVGAANGQAQMRNYTQRCPDANLILLGFSQGGSVAQDILGGGGGAVFECEQAENAELDAATGSKIMAAATFGAVVRSRDQNFTVGAGKPFDGKRARTPAQVKGLTTYTARLRDYCHYGDPMCAVGSEPADVFVHLDYFEEHNDEVVNWIEQRANETASNISAARMRVADVNFALFSLVLGVAISFAL